MKNWQSKQNGLRIIYKLTILMLIHLSFRNRLNSLIHYLPLLSRSRNGGKTLNIHQTYIPPGNMINVNVNTCIYLRCLNCFFGWDNKLSPSWNYFDSLTFTYMFIEHWKSYTVNQLLYGCEKLSQSSPDLVIANISYR